MCTLLSSVLELHFVFSFLRMSLSDCEVFSCSASCQAGCAPIPVALMQDAGEHQQHVTYVCSVYQLPTTTTNGVPLPGGLEVVCFQLKHASSLLLGLSSHADSILSLSPLF